MCIYGMLYFSLSNLRPSEFRNPFSGRRTQRLRCFQNSSAKTDTCRHQEWVLKWEVNREVVHLVFHLGGVMPALDGLEVGRVVVSSIPVQILYEKKSGDGIDRHSSIVFH